MVWTYFKKGRDCVKKCMDYEVEGVSPGGRPGKPGVSLWKETVGLDSRPQ